MKKTLLRVRVRVFTRQEKSLIKVSGGFIEPGTMVEFGNPETLNFNHGPVVALPVKGKKEDFYVLRDEIDSEYDQRAS